MARDRGAVQPATRTAPVAGVPGVAYRDTVPDGTLVLSSGLGGVFPRGHPDRDGDRRRREEAGLGAGVPARPAANPSVGGTRPDPARCPSPPPDFPTDSPAGGRRLDSIARLQRADSARYGARAARLRWPDRRRLPGSPDVAVASAAGHHPERQRLQSRRSDSAAMTGSDPVTMPSAATSCCSVCWCCWFFISTCVPGWHRAGQSRFPADRA